MPLTRGLVDVGARVEEQRREIRALLLQHDDERRFAEPIARIDHGAGRELALQRRGIRVARGDQEARVDRQVLGVGRRLGERACCDAIAEERQGDPQGGFHALQHRVVVFNIRSKGL